MIDVLIDMTPLNSGSRDRGIGRYVRSLCGALARREEWLSRYPVLARRSLSLAGLTQHKGSSASALDFSLSFPGTSTAVTREAYQRYKLERRLYLGRTARASRARILHLPEPPGTPWDGRVPRIVTCHDLIPLLRDGGVKHALQSLRHRVRFGSARRVIAVSAATRRDLIQLLGVPETRIDVVHHGVDHARFSAVEQPGERELVRERLRIRGEFLLYLGAADRRKNLELLIRAFAESGLPRDLELVLAGAMSAAQCRELEQCARRERVERSVRVAGFVEDALLSALYRQCLAHVFVSAYEGFGLPVLEAMACGAPTLISSVPALIEVAGDAALSLESLDEPTLARALARLASDAALRAELRARGLARAAEFTWERCAAGTLASYARLLDEVAG
jgi:glycosyltransferase involved in cell wall biosynthesis